MANRIVTLYIRVKTKDGRKPYCQPVYLTNGRLKPLYAMVDGKPENRPEGSYSPSRIEPAKGRRTLIATIQELRSLYRAISYGAMLEAVRGHNNPP
jgi:hypothetical protein